MGAASSAELPAEIFLPAEMFLPDYCDAAGDPIDHSPEKAAEEDSSPLAFLWK